MKQVSLDILLCVKIFILYLMLLPMETLEFSSSVCVSEWDQRQTVYPEMGGTSQCNVKAP